MRELGATGLVLGCFLFFQGGASAETARPQSCPEIQRLLDESNAEELEIFLEDRTYTCESPLVIRRNRVHVEGVGSGKTIIESRRGLAMPVVLIGEPYASKAGPAREVSDVSIHGLTIAGHWREHPDPANHECYDFDKGQSTHCEGSAFLVRNNGLTVRGAHRVRITDLEVYGHVSGGVVLEKNSSRILIDGFKAFDNYFDGFAGYSTVRSVVRNFEIYGNQYSGISVDIRFTTNLFENGIVRDNQDNGIFSAQVGQNIYRNLEVSHNKKYGFYFDGSWKKGANGKSALVPDTCNGNQVEQTMISGSQIGIYVNHACKDLILKQVDISEMSDRCTRYHAGAEVEESGVRCI